MNASIFATLRSLAPASRVPLVAFRDPFVTIENMAPLLRDAPRGSLPRFSLPSQVKPSRTLGEEEERVTCVRAMNGLVLACGTGVAGSVYRCRAGDDDDFAPAERVELRGHKMRLGRAAFHPQGEYALTTSHDRTMRMWSLR